MRGSAQSSDSCEKGKVNLDWTLGNISLLEGYSNIATGCSGRWWQFTINMIVENERKKERIVEPEAEQHIGKRESD